ncbi:MAG TPA: aminotransferase class V-fold PLP-dependent enzyme [Gemmatimonadaceae bacterium]|nr:aminotransferase class V-fold PLP-dependent enzyme [Gemmatimonadaceae bacterium]
MPEPGYNIDALRRRIPLLASCIPFNNCSQGPQTDATRAAAEQYLESWNRTGMDWEAWIEEVRLAKVAFAALIGASPEDIAVFSSVSEAMSAVASALDFSGKRRRVVLSEIEFPTTGHIWLAQQRRGARVSWVAQHNGVIETSEYEAAIDDDTALVAACHGYFLNGFTQDLSAIVQRAHAHDALVFADAYQTVGTQPIDVRETGVDFLASGTLKYLMGVPGIAFLYVRPELVNSLEPSVTGWFGRSNPFSFDIKGLTWSAGASRFDSGTPPIINAYIGRAGMEMIAGIGVGKIRAWHEVLAARLRDGGRERGLTQHGTTDLARKTANTAFVVNDSHAIEQAMRARGVLPSARGPVIRLSPHFYNTLDDIDTALDLLAELTRGERA